jgi:hypothetical protein
MTVSNLCLSVFFENDELGPYDFIYGGEANGKPYWNASYNDMVMQWNSGNTYWEVVNWISVENSALRCQTETDFPTSNWKLIGRVAKNEVIVTSGSCGAYTPLVLNATITNNTCSSNCDGIIVANAKGQTKPYLYSINNGVTYTPNPIFGNLCGGDYNIIVSANTTITTSKTFSVGFNGLANQYGLSLENISQTNISNDTVQTTWKLNIDPPLKTGDVLTIGLNANLETRVSEPGTASTLNTLSVYKNNTLLTGNTNTSTTTLARPYCSPYLDITNYSGITYSTTLVSGDTLTGITTSVITNLELETGTNGCSTRIEQKNLIRITSAAINTCKCCELIYNSDSNAGINSHIR